MADTDVAAPALPAPSAFLHLPKTVTNSATPSIIHLKRDLLLPLSFAAAPADAAAPLHRDDRDGRSGASSAPGILNTRFGDFPHASILGQPYGAQVRATNLGHSNRKRKRRIDPAATEPVDEDHNTSGFLHILAPTAELWTASLPHRTQVVYTPDSSFILHKLGVRPGSVLIEAGAGSGSFTHAGVRAVYAGYPDGREGPAAEGDALEEAKRREREGAKALRKGHVWSFEFHRERVGKLREEIEAHGLEGLVEVVHRDVCKDGFLVRKRVGKEADEEDEEEEEEEEGEFESPGATAIFLDLPAPWLALPHLTRNTRPIPSLPTSTRLTPTLSPAPASAATPQPSTTSSPPSCSTGVDSPSALSPTETVRICTFSPCIEQVTRTVSVLRKLGWAEIEMHELQHRRLEVRRNNRRGYEDGAGPRTVAEAVQRLKWVGEYRNTKKEKDALQAAWQGAGDGTKREGPLVTRVEPEVKTHTSYLVFAVLPREWTAQQEKDIAAYVSATTRGTVNAPVVGEGEKWKWTAETVQKVSKRQLKKLERDARKAGEVKEEGGEKSEGEGEDKMEVDE